MRVVARPEACNSAQVIEKDQVDIVHRLFIGTVVEESRRIDRCSQIVLLRSAQERLGTVPVRWFRPFQANPPWKSRGFA
jgi:hypothetical protein